MCGLGGLCVDCDTCPRTICNICLVFLGPDIVTDESASFVCPFCHTNSPRRTEAYFVSPHPKYPDGQGSWPSFQPFRRGKLPVKTVVGLIKTPSIRGTFPRMNSGGLAIVNFHLFNIDRRGDPFQAVVNYLEPFFSSDANDKGLSTLSLDFNIDATDLESLERHQRVVNGFVQRMCQCVENPLVWYCWPIRMPLPTGLVSNASLFLCTPTVTQILEICIVLKVVLCQSTMCV